MLPTVTTWMNQLHLVLRSGGSSPSDFTLHNDEHAFRVAERIGQLLTTAARKNISDYELALLLLAAYGHDIGMTPERQLVARHHRHLFAPKESQLTTNQECEFQRFIDDYPARAVTLPLTTSIDDLNLADELTAYYVRESHNDWSGAWLREHLHGQLANLPDSVSILIRLCQSHHWGFDRLAHTDFDPRLSAGSAAQLIHLRYLACLLRLADILENDPERTPEVIFRHRSIQDRPKSLAHWIKDHHFTIDEQDGRLLLHATPPNARIHHAIEQLADWIDHELRGIAAFGEKLPVEYKVGHNTIRREWHLAPALIRHIQPQPGTYRYIDGAFRPNTQRLLQLLSNEQLYGKPVVAVRELLQNAFDAVREKIARKRLEHHIPDKADRKWEKLLGDQESVTLTLRRVTEVVNDQEQIHYLLICNDTGVGLTERLITGHLLVSGQSRRHAVLELERQCQEAGFQLGRTGQFGIGVLSYFMLAKEVRLTTTRFQGCGDSEGQSWHFTTHGLSDFGELRPCVAGNHPTGGTRVEWVLRSDRIGDEAKFAQDLRQYLLDTLVRIPCQFEFQVDGFPKAVAGWQLSTGWTRTLAEWKDELVSKWTTPDEKFAAQEFPLSPEDVARRQAERAIYVTALEQATAALRLEETEVSLPNSLGWTRLILPCFELPEGRCLLFPIVDEQGRTLLNGLHGLSLLVSDRTAWKGMDCCINQSSVDDDGEISEAYISTSAFISEADFQHVDRETLEVSRSSLVLADDVVSAVQDALESAAQSFADKVLKSAGRGFYHELNLAMQFRSLTLKPGAGWWVLDGGVALRPLNYPLVLWEQPNLGQPRFRQHIVRTNKGEIAQHLMKSMSVSPEGNRFPAKFPMADRLCLYRSGDKKTFKLIRCWERPPTSFSGTVSSRFPAEWRNLILAYEGRECVAWQVEHPLFRLLSEAQRTDLIDGDVYQLAVNWDALHTLDSAGDIILQLIGVAAKSLYAPNVAHWQQFQNNHPDVVRRLWQTLADASGQSLADISVIVTDQFHCIRLTPEGIVRAELKSLKFPFLPEVTDPEFLLVEARK